MFYRQILVSFLVIQFGFFFSLPTSIFSVFNSSRIVQVKEGNVKFCRLAPIFHLATYLILITMLKSAHAKRIVLIT